MLPLCRNLLKAAVIAPVIALAAGCSSASSTAAAPQVTPAAHRTTALPASRALTAAVITTRLKQLVPDIGRVKVLTAADDPNHLLGRPSGYTSKTVFGDKRITGQNLADGVQAGGEIEVFPATALAKDRADYIQIITANLGGLLAEYDYLAGPVLLRLTATPTPAKAGQYAKALAAITGSTVTESK